MRHQNTWQLVAGLSGFMAVAMGAVAAHAMHSSYLAAYAERGSGYQMIHSVVLLWLVGRQGRGYAVARWLFAVGILCFCGAFYIMSVVYLPEALKFAPFGGSCLMLGWLALAFAGRKYF